MRQLLFLATALVFSLGLSSCSHSSKNAAGYERQLEKIADALTALPSGGAAGSPILKEIDIGSGGKLVVLAFSNGDYQAWVVTAEGTVKGAGFQQGSMGTRLVPGGISETR